MIYIDFDGVILDTEELLFEEWRKNPERNLLPKEVKIDYIRNADWNYIINHAPIINNSVEALNEMDPNNTIILTKIHSLRNEGQEKIKWLKQQGIKQKIIFVPYFCKKTDMVETKDNVLVDDCLQNLRDWAASAGIPVFFDIDNDGFDSWQQPHTEGYQKILRLSDIPKITK